MADDLSKLLFLMRLGRQAVRVVRQNIGFALLIKAVAIVAVFPGWLTLWLAVLGDMGASVLVTLNGMRMLALQPTGLRIAGKGKPTVRFWNRIIRAGNEVRVQP